MEIKEVIELIVGVLKVVGMIFGFYISNKKSEKKNKIKKKSKKKRSRKKKKK